MYGGGGGNPGEANNGGEIGGGGASEGANGGGASEGAHGGGGGETGEGDSLGAHGEGDNPEGGIGDGGGGGELPLNGGGGRGLGGEGEGGGGFLLLEVGLYELIAFRHDCGAPPINDVVVAIMTRKSPIFISSFGGNKFPKTNENISIKALISLLTYSNASFATSITAIAMTPMNPNGFATIDTPKIARP